MKVLYILNSTIRQGGATKSFLILLNGLIRKGVTPTVVVPDRNGVFEDLQKAGIETIALPYRAAAYPPIYAARDYLLFLPRTIVHQYLNWRASRKLYQMLKNRSFDIIHTNVSVIGLGFKLSRRLSVPHIYHFREYADKDFRLYYFPSKKRIFQELDQQRSYSVCITKDIQAYHRQDNTKRSRVIYNGIHAEVECLKPLKREAPFFLFAGRVEPAKDLLQILRAYTIGQIKTPLYVAGETLNEDYLNKVRLFINQRGLNNRVSLLGPRDDIESLMQQASAIIISSRNEAFGRCMAEAMFNGCLVIGRNTGGTKEQFDNGLKLEGEEIGLRYESEEDLARILTEVESGRDAFEPYTGRAFHTVNTLYTSEVNISETYHFYEDILNERID